MYKWNAKEYHKSSSQQQKWAEELIGKLKLRGDERVLDIGCGDGKVTIEIAKCLPKGLVLGIDSSQEMIRFAQENFPKRQRRFVRLDSYNLAAGIFENLERQTTHDFE